MPRRDRAGIGANTEPRAGETTEPPDGTAGGYPKPRMNLASLTSWRLS
jgi:hypothetical protein